MDFYRWRQERINFNSVRFQILSRVGHLIFFNKELTDEQKIALTKTLASLDYRRTSSLWENSVVIDDGNGNKKIITQIAAINKGCRVAVAEVERLSGINLR